MRTYDQYCPAARALDVVGDRWTLLIVRELLNRGAARYTDLKDGLPGIATNLLADRLRELEENGIITRDAAPPPIATTLFRLTPRGEALKPVLTALGLWGMPLLEEASEDAAFRSHWLVVPLEYRLSDHTPARPPVTIEVRTGDQPMVIETVEGTVRVRPGTAENPDAIMSGPPPVVMDVLMRDLDLATARTRGAAFEGNPEALRRLTGSGEDADAEAPA
ncbi:MAG TPA: winged helix-turn-helix transcriptional regulator [Acidimicrobiia bacterium]|nr:winged helix-turn-helix transcriptional regulator [Acidimicrobiia bacterium]